MDLNSVNQTPARNPEWLVLRVPSKQTFEYEQHFKELGIKCWTPVVWIKRRLPRKRIGFWTQAAVLPSYLFLLTKDVPKFRVLPYAQRQDVAPMVVGGRFVVLDDKELDGLREYDKRTRDAKAQPGDTLPPPPPTEPPELPALWEVGDKVIVRGMFNGLEGEVIGVKGNEVKVAIKNPAIKIDISGFLLTQMG